MNCFNDTSVGCVVNVVNSSKSSQCNTVKHNTEDAAYCNHG